MRLTQLHSLPFLVACALVMAIIACDGTTPPPKVKPVTLPADTFVEVQPMEARSILEAKRTASAGQRVAIIGRVGGSTSPIVSQRAVFTMVDASLKSCAEMGEDHCPTPADYCCEERGSLANAMASVSLVDANGVPLAISLEAEGSIKPLMLLVVEGTLQPTSDHSFNIHATHLYKVPNDPLASKIK